MKRSAAGLFPLSLGVCRSTALTCVVFVHLIAPAAHAAGVVGTGTADSCTDAALDTALSGGGLVTFNCGGPATIDISTGTGTKTIDADTAIDGGGHEECDDGNTVGGDGCAANCTHEDRRTYSIAGGTCVGGSNDGASCRSASDCPGGIGPTPCASAVVDSEAITLPLALSGQEILTTGRARASDPGGVLPFVIKAADVHFDPAKLPGLECVCVRAVPVDAFGFGNAGVGEIGCGARGLSDVDIASTRDHYIRDVDPTCATGSPDPRRENACVGPLMVTRSGGRRRTARR